MNQTPRTINRILLAVFGLGLMLAGALAMALGVPAVARWWQSTAAQAGQWVSNVLDATTLPGQRDSWLWIVLALLMVLLIILMFAWVANQGKGRSGTLAYDDDDHPVPGSVTINAAVAEQALKAALSERVDLVNSAVSTYEFRGRPALKVKVFPRQGVAPYVVAEEVSALVSALDAVLGVQTPVLISISSGARSRFTRAERVR
ncbi:hypothetical protein ASH00_05875 [Arthrobacter sp. Soil782]|uniref:hypothetical protein n=1 Tax=Arthrobacter sp. Soil782 TaxID=1736410 RepID=UPI0006F76CED|nr:hypothetical protein [Arthrobacter sp. Soil782]KRF09169.1 hypothetical protein ASH00_05875 [Arthrobacter sp. Soil782]